MACCSALDAEHLQERVLVERRRERCVFMGSGNIPKRRTVVRQRRRAQRVVWVRQQPCSAWPSKSNTAALCTSRLQLPYTPGSMLVRSSRAWGCKLVTCCARRLLITAPHYELLAT
jgi:hypothetical protein